MTPIPEPASPGDNPAEPARPPSPGFLEELSSTLGSVQTHLASFLALVALEARRAGLTFVSMMAMALVAAVCGIGAWLGLLAAVGMWAVSAGFQPIPVLVAIASANLLLAAVLGAACTVMSRALVFPATRRQLSRPTSPAPEEL